MPAAAPTIPLALLRVIARRSRPGVVYADVWRAVGTEADRRGVTRPSYQQVRIIAREVIARRARRRLIAVTFAEGTFDTLVVRGMRKQGWALHAAAEELARSYRSRARK